MSSILGPQIIYPENIPVDDATKARTEEFFHLTGNNASTTKLIELINQGIALEAEDYLGETPLHRATNIDCLEVIRALVAVGVQIDKKTNIGMTPLAIAARDGATKTVEFLLTAGADVNVQNKYGKTPLHLAAEREARDITRLLIAAGANIEAQDYKNITTLSYAIFDPENPDTDILKILIGNGANIYGGNLNKGEESFLQIYLSPKKFERYKNFVETGQVPKFDQEFYDLLAFSPVMNSSEPVDYANNLRRIFTHVKWQNKEQAAAILSDMQKGGTINTEIAESILSNIFPQERSYKPLLQQSGRER